MIIAFAALYGLIFGSFFNVVIWRLPRHESLVTPGSHCPSCGAPVRAYDNVPVLSWLLLGGRCRSCRGSISVRYPAVELLTAFLTVAVAVFKHSTHTVVLDELLVLMLVPVALIDFDHRIIPNTILAVGAVAALAAGAIAHPSGLPQQLIAGAGAGLFLLIFALAYPKGMGMGDVKLAAVLGLFLGTSVSVAILAALIAGIVFGAGAIVRDGSAQARKKAIAFGPFLAFGGVVAILWGEQVVHWYLHTVV